MDIASSVDSLPKDPESLPATRIVRTYIEDAARLQGNVVSSTPPLPEKKIESPAAISTSVQGAAPPAPPLPAASVTIPTQAPAIPPRIESPPLQPPIEKRPQMIVFPSARQVPQQAEAIQEAGARVAREQGSSPLHTYELDFANHVKKTNSSPLSVFAAERDAIRPETPYQEQPPARQVRWYIGIGAALLVLGAGGSYVAYRYVVPETATLFPARVSSLIFADEQQEIVGTGKTLQNAVIASMSDMLPSGAVRILFVSTSTPESIGRQPLPGKKLIEMLELSAPDILLRNSTPESTFGILRAGDTAYPFFILRVTSYESTFRGMLDWEKSMAEDLALFYPIYPATPLPEIEIASTTATSTEPFIPTTPAFHDSTIANNDVRVLLDAEGRTILLYGYRDKTTLVIARDAAAFSEIVQRLAATRQQ